MPGVALLLALLAAQLALSESRQSLSWDEGDHVYAGYRSLTHTDFGLNPEHPPFVKMLAALPLLPMRLHIPPLQNRDFKREAFLGGRAFVFGNDADALLRRARLGPALLTLLLALLAFVVAREMFGTGAGFMALALLAFDPNLLAHGAFVTTDVGLSLFMLAAVFAFYRYAKAPSAWRLALVGAATGLALATKHAGVLVPFILVLLAATELIWGGHAGLTRATTRVRAQRLLAALAVVGVLALAILWAFYGFRYAARPSGLALNPPLTEVLAQLSKPHQAGILAFLARWHLLPESYLYGLADVFVMESFYHSYVLGTVYLHGVWFYFPFAFLVKSSLAFVLLPLAILGALAARLLGGRREILFLAIPPTVHFMVAMGSGMNIGVRHILPVYPFLAVLGSGALSALVLRNRRWLYAVGAVLLLHVGSSARAFPAYIAYSNELWGGPSATHRLLTDSNSDWGQQLKSLKRYLDGHPSGQCWFAYFAQGPVDWSYYGIPCRPLPTIDGFWLGEVSQVPAEIEGTVVISAGVLSGFEYGPPPLQPYASFRAVRPTALIDGGIFVFDGRFRVAEASAMGLARQAEDLLAAGEAAGAARDAQRAVDLAPTSVKANTVLADALSALGRKEEAARSYEAALFSARMIAPEFQEGAVPGLEAKLKALKAP